MSHPMTYVEAPLETTLRVQLFFREHGAGYQARGFQLPFITKECRLSASETMAALCVLMECGEIEMSVGRNGWEWTFFPKGARG